MKKIAISLVLLVFVWGCASSTPITGYTGSSKLKVSSLPSASSEKKGEIIITESNVGILEGRWLGSVKVVTARAGTLEQSAVLDIKNGEKKVLLTLGRLNIFDGFTIKDGCLFSEKKKTGEWLKVAILEERKIKVEFSILNKNPMLPNVTGEGVFLSYQK